MKIAILTQPLHINYGGLLQNYALQYILRQMGHAPQTIHICRKTHVPLLWRCLSWGKRLLRYYLLHQDVTSLRFDYHIPTEDYKRIAQHMNHFVANHIASTPLIQHRIDIGALGDDFDAYIVGSDQVWRPRYNPYIEECFLSFLPSASKARRIAYAASFGTSLREFTKRQIALCQPYIQQFHAISVREQGAINLCRNYFNVEAKQMVDPTMLLEPEEYLSLLTEDGTKCPIDAFCYILDSDSEKCAIIRAIAEQTGHTLRHFMPIPYSVKARADLNQCVFPPVKEWIRGIANSSMVITDSFHGTVFAILFNKPFITINNPARGSDRFDSLFNLFGLRHRMIGSVAEVTPELLNETIDWSKINAIREQEKKRSLHFLRNALHTPLYE